ncbi:hypothetical protein UFOVP787_183 [uncultured Caudovirales phage]|uniref:Uncharacterized protein n=1 Tax=uncultured Caudovirales phage TaxID=2100421 RepID=A0A6J5P5X4_9CAUD|nr:hypothetical protein UFOVP787_183 [uncultured Caudovirales phage]
MSLMPVYFSTTSTKKRKKSGSKKLADSKAKHEAWIKSITGGKKADKKSLDFNWKQRYNHDMKVDQSDYVSAGLSGDASSCAKRDIMSNLHKEPEHVRKEILAKASRVMPLFNKGGLQYATPETDLTMVGSKSRRG